MSKVQVLKPCHPIVGVPGRRAHFRHAVLIGKSAVLFRLGFNIALAWSKAALNFVGLVNAWSRAAPAAEDVNTR